MKINFTDTFGKSLKRMINRERWYWKTWDFLRYDMPNFLKNVWRFRKDLYSHTWYGGEHSVLPFMKTAIDHMADKIEKQGHEVDSSRLKKVEKMRRASYLLDCFIKDSFIELAEAELGELVLHDWEFEDVPDKPGYSQLVDKDTPEEKEHNSKVFARSREIQEQMWTELWRILQGKDYNEFTILSHHIKVSGDDSTSAWDDWFDGSDLRGWWD